MTLTDPQPIWSGLDMVSGSLSFGILSTALARILATMVSVTAACFLGMWMASASDSVVSPFWPASGVAVGAVLLWGWAPLIGVYTGVLASNIFFGLPMPFVWAGPLGMTAESALAAAIVRGVLGSRTRLDNLRGVLVLVIGAAWVPALLNALICGLLLPLADGGPFLTDRGDMVRFILANGFGIALFTPAMLVWWRAPSRSWWWRFAVVIVLILIATWLCSAAGQSVFLLLIPLLAGAVATGLRGVSIASALTAVGIVLLGDAGFSSLTSHQSGDYSLVYSMFAVLAFGVLPVGAASGEYRRLLRQRRAAEQAAGLRFWEWNDTDGCQIEQAGSPEKLFDETRVRGSIETEFDGHRALSFWQTVARRADGSPREVAGMLIDASERLLLEETRRNAWKSEVELRNLRASLTPHLLFNCLAAMRGIVRTDPEKAREFIDYLSRFLRETTDAQSREALPLHEEWQLCEDFLGLQAFRYEHELPRVVSIEGAAHHALVPPMMLLNLVENAVKHGEVSQRHPLKVQASLRDGHLVAEIRNHGLLRPSREGHNGGVGTANARLQAIYGADASLVIRQDGEDVCALLSLPAKPPVREGGNV